MEKRVDVKCPCDSEAGFSPSDDGFFYCNYCGIRAEGILKTGVAEEDRINVYSVSCSRTRKTNVTPVEPVSQAKLTPSMFYDHVDISHHLDMKDDGVGPTEPSDFGNSLRKTITYEEYYTEIRLRYLKGLQIMIQLQAQALIEQFNVNPLIVGIVGPIWLRFLASTGIQADEWADSVVHESEARTQGEAEEFQPSANCRNEPVNIHGKRLVYAWYKSLRSTLPISCSLATSFLVCHLAREPILPPDMIKWTLEGKLPYFAAFGDIEKQLGPPSEACPITASRMFRPVQAISSQQLESMAADFAQKIGLVLPPVNFYAVASRYLRQLSLPVEKLLPLSCRLCDWSNPPELHLSANESRLPTRVCVMSILIVAVRTHFNINGYGTWESGLSNPKCSLSRVRNEDTESQSHLNATENAYENLDAPDSRSSVVELLKILEAKYYELDDGHDKDEEDLVNKLWEFYQEPGASGDVSESKENGGSSTRNTSQKNDDSECNMDEDQDSANGTSKESFKEQAIKKLKLDMNENQFCYIRPRVKVKNRDYLHYARRREDVLIYAVHADYYILLRCCAKVAQVEPRIMHVAVLSLERRLQLVEKKIDHLLHCKPNFEDLCKLCEDKTV